MKTLLVLSLFGLALLAAPAQGADAGEEETIVKKVQGYIQQVTQTAKDAFSKVQEAEPLQQSRDWVLARADDVSQFLWLLKDKFSSFWGPEETMR